MFYEIPVNKNADFHLTADAFSNLLVFLDLPMSSIKDKVEATLSVVDHYVKSFTQDLLVLNTQEVSVRQSAKENQFQAIYDENASVIATPKRLYQELFLIANLRRLKK